MRELERRKRKIMGTKRDWRNREKGEARKRKMKRKRKTEQI